MKSDIKPRFMTISEFSIYIRVSKSFIRRKMKVELFEGQHYFYLSDKTLRFEIVEIDKWIKSRFEKKKKKLVMEQIEND